MDHNTTSSSPSEGSAADIPSTTVSSAPSQSPERTAIRLDQLDQKTDPSLAGLFAENAAAKIWRVAESFLEEDAALDTYPEYILPQGETAGRYTAKPAAFWTCGFFPASLYCLLERTMRYGPVGDLPTEKFHPQLLALCRRWSAPLHAQATRTTTHDLGFMMRPLRMDWELTSNLESLRGYVTAAESLATRYDPLVGAVRSWDRAVSHRYEITDPATNFLIIVDSMCNMDLLFYAARHAQQPRLAAIATAHARTVLRTLVRADGSTWHVANLDPALPGGVVQHRMTHQGYADGSTWSRGQAWALLGFAQTYGWTGDAEFLTATQRVADCFLKRIDASPAAAHRYVPLWDFDAPVGDADQQDASGQPLRDASAGLIAANGLLLLHQALTAQAAEGAEGSSSSGYSGTYLQAALCIARDTLGYALDREDVARFEVAEDGATVHVPPGAWDAILRHSTANNNQYALQRYADVGLVYADYYFLELGNQLLRMGLVAQTK